MSESTGFTLGDKRCSVVLNAGPNVPQLSAKDFFARFIPDSGLTPKQQKEIETRVARTARDRGRWLAFPLDPNNNDDSEDVAFQGFVDIARAVHDAALYCVPGLKATTKFDNIPDGAPETSNRPNQTRPDGHFVSLAPQSRSVKHPHWVDIAATGEYKKNGTSKKMLTDDIQKALWSMHHTMREDASRRFTFAFTVENCTMRIWFASRSEIVVSASFNFMTDANHLIQFFLAFTFASREKLGWDPTMKSLWNGVAGSPLQYDITVRDMDTLEEKVYRTEKLISDVGADHIRGRGTRVWKVHQVLAKGGLSKDARVLKDAWVDSDRVREGRVMNDILSSTDDPVVKARMKTFLLTKETHGDVYVGGVADHTIDGPSREKYIKNNKTKFFLRQETPTSSTGTNSRSTIIIDMPVGSCNDGPAPKPKEVAKPVYYHSKFHYRIVFEEECVTLHSIKSMRASVFVLMKACRALHALHNLGWVHRDISTGNILLFGKQVKLADLEYAKRITVDEPAHAGIRTGTKDFMSIEVHDQQYCFAPIEKTVRTASRTNFEEVDAMCMVESGVANKPLVVIEQDSLIRPWFYNPLNDLESILWIFARQVLYQDHYLQRCKSSSLDYVTVPIDDKFLRFPAMEESEDRIIRIKAYFSLGHGLFVSHASRQTFLTSNQKLLKHLVHYPLLPAARPLGVALKNMRNDIVQEYIKWESKPEEIDHRCAEELHLIFVDWLKFAYDALCSVEGEDYKLMARSLQSEMAMITDQEALAAANQAPSTNSASGSTVSSKRSRSDADIDDEDENAVAHPSKSPRTETNRSPHQQSVVAVDPSPVIASPPPPPPVPAPVLFPKAAPKRKARAVPLPTRTLRSHALKTVVKTESDPEPTVLSPSPPPAPVRGRKAASTAVRGRGKATKNNEAIRAAAKVAAKVKNTTRKGR